MTISKYYNIARDELYKLNRSLTGKDTKKTLKIIKREFPKLKIKKLKAGTKVFDWRIPSEWNVTDAFIIDKYGKKIVNFKDNNLHLIGYSKPVSLKINKDELLKNLYSIKGQPNAIPYITSYYRRKWGFCVNHKQKKEIKKKYKSKDIFIVKILSNFNKRGFLNYGEFLIKGKSKDEILISTYICHPSMANNELSGPIVSMSLINYFKNYKNLNKSIRFIFIPETIGSIAYIKHNFKKLKEKVIGGYNLSCIGDEREYSCMFSKYGNSPSDESLIQAYKRLKIKKYKVYSFLKRGSDERQFNSPGIDLKISSIFRTKYGEYPEYHTSLDDFKLVTIKGVRGGFNVAKEAIKILIGKIVPKNKILCEPQMSKRGLYPTLSVKGEKYKVKNYMNFLQYSDGNNTLEGIAKKINLKLKFTKKIYLKLKNNKLVY